MTMQATQQPVAYFPVSHKPFEFKAGLKRLPAQPVNGEPGSYVFQVDSQWPRYRHVKLASRREELDKYVCEQGLSESAASRVTAFMLRQLGREYGHYFQLSATDKDIATLQCRLSGETLVFDDELKLRSAEGSDVTPAYRNSLDALCCQIQEDLAITECANHGDFITYLHLCLPNYWAAQDKIGRSFVDAHRPVPAMDRITAQAGNLTATLMRGGPFERFTWGLTSDARLNHHPRAAPGWDAGAWHGRVFDADHPELYLRTERQVTIGLPDAHAFAFTIRTYLRDVRELNTEELQRLVFAIDTMPAEVLSYKGLAGQKEAITAWLNELATAATP